uniref:Putative secreted protein n=1 Tax=Ixodes ricinus TaxID=34613 RepID=A0A6B0U3T8_IXORI
MARSTLNRLILTSTAVKASSATVLLQNVPHLHELLGSRSTYQGYDLVPVAFTVVYVMVTVGYNRNCQSNVFKLLM